MTPDDDEHFARDEQGNPIRRPPAPPIARPAPGAFIVDDTTYIKARMRELGLNGDAAGGKSDPPPTAERLEGEPEF